MALLCCFICRRSSCGGKATSQGRACLNKQPLPPSVSMTPVSQKRSQTQRTNLKMSERVSEIFFCTHLTCQNFNCRVKYRRPSLYDSLRIIYYGDLRLNLQMWRGFFLYLKGFAVNVS